MSTAAEIISVLGGASQVSRDLVPPAPVQTVHYWKSSGSIPAWRRQAIRELSRRKKVILTDTQDRYLADSRS